MSLKKKGKSSNKRSRKKSSKKQPVRKFKLRFPNMWWRDGDLDTESCWHEVEAASLKEAKMKFAGGSIHKVNDIISEQEDMKGIPKSALERYKEIGGEIEPMILYELEKKVGSPIESVSYQSFEHWFVETEDGDEYNIYGSLDSANRVATDYLVDMDIPDNLQHYPQWLVENHINEDYFFRQWSNDLYDMAYEEVEYAPEEHGLTDKDVRDNTDAFEKKVESLYEQKKENIKDRGIPDYLRDLGMEDSIYEYVNERDLAKEAVDTDGFAHILGLEGDEISLPYGAIAYGRY